MSRTLSVVVWMALLAFAGTLAAKDSSDEHDAHAGPYVEAGVVLHLNSDPAVDTWRMGGEGQGLFFTITAYQQRAGALRKLAADPHRLGLLLSYFRNSLKHDTEAKVTTSIR